MASYCDAGAYPNTVRACSGGHRSGVKVDKVRGVKLFVVFTFKSYRHLL